MTADRNCTWCGNGLGLDRRPDALYCGQTCRKAAHRARHPYVPVVREPKPSECSVSDCARDPYALGLCAAHWKNRNRYGDPLASYEAAHQQVRRLRGPADSHQCIKCWRTARDWAYQHTAGDAELRTPKGSPFSMRPEDYAPMCGTCHSALDRSHGGAQQGRRRDLPWIGRGNRSPFPFEWRTSFRWACADGKRPIRPNGAPASSTAPETWTSWDIVRGARVGDGVGIMLGRGLGCYDLDHVTDEQAREFIATIPEPIVYVERSMSGDGVHVFVTAPESVGWKRNVDGISVERYTRARFIRLTGNRWDKEGRRATQAPPRRR